MPERPASPHSVVPPPCAQSAEAATNTVISRNSVPTLNQQQHEDQEAGPSRAGDESGIIKGEPIWNYRNWNLDEEVCSGLEVIMKAKKEPLDPVSISQLRPVVQLEHIKPDLGKVQEIRSRLNNQNLSKIKAIAKQKPSEFLKSAKDECGFGAAEEVEEDDDEPLDIKRVRLTKSIHKVESSDSEVDSSAVGKTRNRSMGTSKENVESSTIVISDDDSDNDERPNDILRSPDCVLSDSPGRDYDDLSESQVFEFETQQYVASAWNDSDFDASDLAKKPKADQLLKPQVDEAPHEASHQVQKLNQFQMKTLRGLVSKQKIRSENSSSHKSQWIHVHRHCPKHPVLQKAGINLPNQNRLKAQKQLHLIRNSLKSHW